MVMKPPPFKKQEGVGLVEVLVAAAILSLTVGGTILAASRWVKTTSGTSMRNDGSQINGSVMELAAYNPDATWVASQLPTTDASNTTFTISSLVTTSVGTASATQILAGTAWQDADGDGNQVNPSLQYEGTVLAETWNQTIADLVSATPSPGPESSPSPEPEPEPEPSPWTAGVQFNVTSNGGSGKYEYSVTFADGSTCTNPNWWTIWELYLPNIDIARYIGRIGYRRCLASLMFDNASKPLCSNLEHGCAHLDCHFGCRSKLKPVLAIIFL